MTRDFIRTTPRLLPVLLALVCLAGCNSGGSTLDSLYEGVFGDAYPPTPQEAVAMAFNREDADQRRRGIAWLAQAPFGGEEEYLNTYRLFVKDPDASVRAIVASALGRHGTVEDAMLLAVLLRDEDAFVRWQAADALRKLHNPEAVPALIQRLDPDLEEDADVRTAVALALGQYPDRVVFARLATALEDRSYTVVNAARLSLIRLTSHDAGNDPRQWADWAARNPDPFAGQQPYTYQPYQPSRGFWDRYITFWNNDDAKPQAPVGMSMNDGGG